MQGFTVKEIHADPEFACLQDEFIKPANGAIDMHICAAAAHVPEAERNIQTVKERNRSTVSALPYKHYPQILKIAIVNESARALNIVPHANGVSDVFSPFTLIDGHQLDFDKHCALRPGLYCEVHDEPDPSNTEVERTTSGIALGPAPSFSGSWEFMSLQTGRKVTRRDWTRLPITDAVIDRVHELANVAANAEPDAFLHEWQPNVPIIDTPIVQLDQAQPVPPVGAVDRDVDQDNSDADSDSDSDSDNHSDSDTNDGSEDDQSKDASEDDPNKETNEGEAVSFMSDNDVINNTNEINQNQSRSAHATNTRTHTRTQMVSWLTPRIFPSGKKRTRTKWPLRNLKLKLMNAANVSIGIDVLAQKPWNDMAVM